MNKARDISSILDGADLVGFRGPPQAPSHEREPLRRLSAKVGDKGEKTLSAKVSAKTAALSAKVGFKGHRVLSSKAGVKVVRID